MTTASLTSEVCRDGEEFGRLAEEWTDLCARCRTATPFQSHAWLHSWWTSYGVPGALRVFLIRDPADGRLVGAAPLMLRRGPLPALTPLGGAITDYCDVLLDDSRPETAGALAAALADAARTALIDLREVRPGAAAEQVYASWRGPRRRLDDSLCLELPAVPMDALIARMPSSGAQRTRAKLRKLDALGIEERIVAGDEVPTALERLLTLHRRQWEGRGVTPEHTTERFARHLTRAVATMVTSGQARVTEFLLGGEVVAADLTLLSPNLAGGYLYGADPGLRKRKVDVSTLLLRYGAREADAEGRTTLSLLRGSETYKNHWRPEIVGNRRLLLARRRTGLLLLLRATAAGARGWAAGQVRQREWARRLVEAARRRRVASAAAG
ncbi:GNAT family N-acetyltransferase [Streptomyces sp. NPDC048604]|uniref:GNAT family N-acetyltransferase n=1 Tax=Streptomyces sp. NPDC048604 TaxID=3365578 RepID=UPI0037149453